jgi:hypothetical protein
VRKLAKLKLNPELIDKACELLLDGNYVITICKCLDISHDAWYRWLKLGAAQKEGIYHDFYEAVTRAENDAEAKMVAMWRQHMPNDYRAIRDFMERRYPDRWGRHNKMDLNHSGNLEIKVEWL